MSQEHHAKYSPSKLPRIIRCPGSVRLTRELKDKGTIPKESSSSPAAEEGTMLHKVMEKCLRRKELAVPSDLVEIHALDSDQEEACNDCLNFIFALKLSLGDRVPFKEEIEISVSLAPWLDLDPGPDLTGLVERVVCCKELANVYGTLDYALYGPGFLYLIDWKFGKGIEVFPESSQLKAYALAALISLEHIIGSQCLSPGSDVMGALDKLKITLVIGAPRIHGEPFKTYETTLCELFTWLAMDLVPALSGIEGPNCKFEPSETACRWCEAKYHPTACRARADEANSLAELAFKVHTALPTPNHDELSSLLLRAPVLTGYLKDLKSFASRQIKAGKEFPGFKLVHGRSTRVFKKVESNKMPTNFLNWAEDNLQMDPTDFMISKPMSMPQVEKVIGKKVLEDHPEFYDLVIKPKGKLTLVGLSDKREALQFQSAEFAFADLVEEED